ncbi:OPA3-like protein [Yarrowia sp. C11]|nr:OPA3-like protein [Yarrowia sp. C11]KAG5364957.1 OPA3-like protein [Yarrowia sp. E02]
MSGIALKLTSLLVRTIAKPMATAIKGQAKQHPRFKQICISLAQRLHQTDTNLKMRLMGKSTFKVRPLNEAKAIESGATFVAEGFIFSVAGGLILYESFRARRKELNRRETVADDIETLQDEIEWLKEKLVKRKLLEDDYKAPEGLNPQHLVVDKDTNKVSKRVREVVESSSETTEPKEPRLSTMEHIQKLAENHNKPGHDKVIHPESPVPKNAVSAKEN